MTDPAVPPPSWPLDTRWPLVLFPARVETRFAGTTLKVLILPEPPQVDGHEEHLTPGELACGTDYWRAVWRAGPDTGRLAAAWNRLVGDLGSPARAAWVARVTEPDGPRPAETVPVDAEVDPPFAEVTTSATAWTRPPLVRALPTRWWAVARRPGSAPRYGRSEPVTPDLPAGPGPGQGGVSDDHELPPLPAELAWLTGFEAAERVGMGLRIENLPPEMLDQGITELFVFGVDERGDPAAGAATVTTVLEGQAGTDGVALLAAGTPTNTTARTRSGWSGSPGDDATAVGVEDTAPAAGAAAALAAALGLPLTGGEHGPDLVRNRPVRASAPGPLARAAGAAGTDADAARAMRTVLWSGTLGYAVRHLLGPGVAGAEPAARRHYLDHVAADGPLPLIRFGSQPYGVLPALAFSRYQRREDGDHEAGVRLLRALLATVWRPSAAGVRRVTPDAADPGELLVDILSRHAAPASVAVRSLLGPEYVAWLWRFSRARLADDWRERLADASGPLLADLGLPGVAESVLARGVFSGDAFPLWTPLTAGPPPDDPAARLRALAGPLTAEQVAATVADDARTPLLHRLARAALLAEHARAADVVAAAFDLPGAREPAEPELIDIHPGDPTRTLWRRLTVALPDGRTIGAALADAAADLPGTERLREMRAALLTLADVPAADLDRHLGGALGLASYRLDAWITGYATERLVTLRSTQPRGCHVGAYGWVVDLKPAPPLDARTEPLPGEELPLLDAPGQAGYLHAPSPAQATTAAVLRSAFRSRGGDNGGPLAVDLSSRRLRRATGIFAGIRAGQSLPALLGYLVERALHEHPRGLLDRFLPRLRELAPGAATSIGPDGALDAAAGPGLVVDGLELHRRRATLPWGDGLPMPGDPDHDALREVLDELAEAIDAIGDALIAESVHHAAQGNPSGGAGSLDALSRGDAPPPAELEVARTSTGGQPLTHRLLVLANATAADRTRWPVDPARPAVRALAAPELDALAGALLPPPARVRCRLRWRGPLGATADGELRLDALRLTAVEYLGMPPRGSAPAGADLEQRIALVAWAAAPAGVTPGWTLDLDFGRDPAWPSDVLSVAEFLDGLAAVRPLLLQSRPLQPADLLPVGAPAPAASVTGLAQRVDEVRTALTDAVDRLTTGTEPQRRAALLVAAGAGVIGAVPPPAAPRNAAEVVAAAERTAGELRRRLAAAQPLGDTVEALAALVGEDIPMLPSGPAGAAAAFADAIGDSTALQGGDALASSTWLQRYSRVRDGADRLQEALTFAEALDAPAADPVHPPLAVAQLPHVPEQIWAALPGGTGQLSLVVAAPTGLDPMRPLHGLVADEWTEILPAQRRTTGLAFEFDAPAAAPPQALLIGVPADDAPLWTPQALEDTLAETLDLARARAVDPETLGRLGQFLPALYQTVNVRHDAPHTDYTPDAAPAT